jgi:2-dehydro-3-deoxyphosphogluconate aldolase/(4S)-4-hydroxy-2-oxoglutarate aldolase
MSAQDELAAVLGAGRVVAVVTIERVADALPLADALLAGGIRTIEVTMRSAAALSALERIAVERPEAIVGAGTVRRPSDVRAARDAGARFVVSPGFTPALDAAARAANAPWLPGVATASEILVALEAGRGLLKLFPADAAGGISALRAFATVFPEVRFCPTGGIAADNLRGYLALANVVCVAGSWVAAPAAVKANEWHNIHKLAREATELASGV